MFTIRQTQPSNNPFYNRPAQGGWNQCVQGSPTIWDASVLCNCVGYACGRFNEIYAELTGYSGMKYPEFWTNAEDFIEVADRYGIPHGSTPKAGAIMCWLGVGSLAGHVAIVEAVNSDGSVYTSESGWGGPAFWNGTRYNDGNWGCNGSYQFRGFIYNPAVSDIVTPVSRDKYTDQINNKAKDANCRDGASMNAKVLGTAPSGYYNVKSTAEADGYTWYEVEKGKWLAGGDWIEFLKAEERPDAVIYRVRDQKYYVWFPDVENDSDYAGLYGDPVSGFQANLTKGNIHYTSHVFRRWWLPKVKNREDYSGSEYRGQNIDAICIESDIPVKYRVHLLGGDWLPWVSSKDANIDDEDKGFAGILGKVIDGVQVTII